MTTDQNTALADELLPNTFCRAGIDLEHNRKKAKTNLIKSGLVKHGDQPRAASPPAPKRSLSMVRPAMRTQGNPDMTENPPLAAPVQDEVERLAAVLAKTDGLDWLETCALECPHPPGVDECDSSTCVAALHEDHDPDDAREYYLRRARAAIAALSPPPVAASEPVAEAIRAFLAKWDEAEPHINGAIQIATMHHCPYNGPQIGEEIEALRAVLAND